MSAARWRRRWVTGLSLAVIAIAAAGAVPASAEARRLRAYVSCSLDTFRPSHHCFIGSVPHAVFRDTSRLSRRYKVCVRGPGRRFRFCKRARQLAGLASQVNLLRFDAEIGTYTVKWFVRGKRTSVRTWRFYFARGD